MNQTIKISICQFKVSSEKLKNIDIAKKNLIDSCKKSNIVVLPECFICPYDTKVFKHYAEKIPTPVAIIMKYKGKDFAIAANAFADIFPAKKVSTIL